VGAYSPIDIIAKCSPAAANGIIRLVYVSWEKAVSIATFIAWLVIGPYSIVF